MEGIDEEEGLDDDLDEEDEAAKAEVVPERLERV